MFLENILCTISEKYTVRTAKKQIKLISNVMFLPNLLVYFVDSVRRDVKYKTCVVVVRAHQKRAQHNVISSRTKLLGIL